MTKTIDIVQFYISHTCNIACPGCLSFNNYAISGHDLFSDWEKDATSWSKILNPKDMSIIGGEPMTNPDLHNWAIGIRKLFKNCTDFKICTNGLLIDRWRQHIPEWWDNNIILEVSAHTKSHFEKAQKDIESLIGNKNISKYTIDTVTKYTSVPDYYIEDYDVFYVQGNKVVALIAKEYEFDKWGIKNYKNNQLKFFNSDPIRAHDNCAIRNCHYIYKGQLYKCGTVVGAQEFIKKYNVDPQGAKLFQMYKPIAHDQPDVMQKVAGLTDQPIPQCRLCPENPKTIFIKDTDVKKDKTGYKYQHE